MNLVNRTMTQLSKYDIIERIVLMEEDDELFMQVQHLLCEGEIADWDSLELGLKTALELSVRQADEGKLTEHRDVMRDIRLKYGKG
jgi:hypothetical protein